VADYFGTPTPGRGNDPGPVGRLVLLFLWVVLSVTPFLFSIGDLQLAAGAVGTPGTLTVEQCTRLGQGRYDCTGTFAPDGGGPAVAVEASPDSTAGDVRRAQLAPEGDRAVPAGAAGVLAALTIPFLGVVVLAFLPLVALWALGSRRSKRPAIVGGLGVGAIGAVGVVVGMVAAYA
jgi:hypothetical protein